MLQKILGIDVSFSLVVRLPAHGPWEVLRIPPFRRTGCHKKLGHLFSVHVLVNGGVSRCGQIVEQEQLLLSSTSFSDLLNGSWRAEPVIQANEIDFASVDPALLIDHFEIAGLRPPKCAVGGIRPAIRHRLSDFYFGVAGTRVVFLVCNRHRADESGKQAQPKQYLDFHGISTRRCPFSDRYTERSADRCSGTAGARSFSSRISNLFWTLLHQ